MLDARDIAVGVEPDRDRVRQKMLNGCYAVYERRQKVQYSQTRPSQLLKHGLPVRVAAKLISRSDCSGLAALGCDWAGIKPHVDWRYTNTWVQLGIFQREIAISQALKGDLVFYGPKKGDPHHVAIYLGDGKVLTNGHYPMSIEVVDYRPDRIHVRSVL